MARLRALLTRLAFIEAASFDRGCQYTATVTHAQLARAGLRQSMSASGYCYDNAFAETAFASVKSELLDGRTAFESKILRFHRPLRLPGSVLQP